MADKLGLGSEVRQLKLGQSFTTPRSTSFHTIRYDFKPASVDINKMANVDVGNNNQVSVTVPHLDGAGVPQTLFKGSQKPYQKECVLIIDRVTGEITLEKLSSNIQVKKTRAETYKPPPNPPGTTSGSSISHTRPLTPVEQPQTPITQRSSSKTRVTSGSRRNNQTIGLIPKHSPLHASPSHHPSPSHGLPPPRPLERPESVGQSTLASLPMIGLDDIGDVAVAPPPIPVPQNILPPSSLNHMNNNNSNCNSKSPIMHHSEEEQNGVGLLSESSSSSSSDSESDSESDNEATRNGTVLATNGRKSPPVGAPIVPPNAAPSHLLNEDLCLSESATDSD